MKRKNLKSIIVDERIQTKPSSIVEETIEKKLRDIATLLCSASEGKKRKSRLYEDVLAVVARGLFRIALERNGNVKSAAANYLGINRNTFQKKMAKLGIKCENKK
ncbi:MAG TPA: helix-turn-helix domain-containing protein [Syntrophales bacterium]|nr:helix-turn-helix domain-containing protein [Syntrophales bacterium]